MARKELFTTIRTEGAILPSDLLQRIGDLDKALPGLAPSDYGLAPTERINEAIARSWSRLQGLWISLGPEREKLGKTDPALALTRERWLLPLLDELGYGHVKPRKSTDDVPISHAHEQVPIHLLGVGVPLDRRTPKVPGAATRSPHALVQDYLNSTDEALYGFVSNGRSLRLLRDNSSLTRQAFVEFDLEGMFEGEVYPDFSLLWLTCHATRVDGEPPASCLLERWSQAAAEQGARALEHLREGVKDALMSLGGGFVRHPANRKLTDALRTGELSAQDYYRELLRVVYRLLFLFVAEDRNVLHPTETAEKTRVRYARNFSSRRLRELARRHRGGRHSDLWQALCVVVRALGDPDGLAGLGLPSLGGIFAPGQSTYTDGAEITNHELLAAVRALAFTQDGRVVRTVDYRNLGPEEFGSVYESLLDLHPELDIEAAAFKFIEAGGSERKTTGSYYTPPSLVQTILDWALSPVLERAADGDDPESAILRLRVVDPASGSGHFLIAAAHRIAQRLAAVRSKETSPSPEEIRRALRDVVATCIYGIDLNPMAVELCKVGLWMEAMDPGRPLTFLDHHIVAGNALLGVTPRLLEEGIPDDAFSPLEGDDKKIASARRKQNHEEKKKGLVALPFGHSVLDLVGSIAAAMERIDHLPDDSPAEVHEKEKAWEALVQSPDAAHAKLIADTWCAAFVIGKTGTTPGVTEGVLNLVVADAGGAQGEVLDEVGRLAGKYRFLHPHLAFPAMLRLADAGTEPENADTGWTGGFDVVLGNPPWDTLSPDAKEFFATYDASIRFLPRNQQESLMLQLLEDTTVAERWRAHRRDLFALVHFLKNSGRYRLFAPGNLGKGDFNIYRMFVEAAMQLARPGGYVAQVVPAGFYGGTNAMAIRKELFEHWDLKRVVGFINTGQHWFSGVDATTRFCAYAARKGGSTEEVPVAFEVREPEDLAALEDGRFVHLSVAAIRQQSADALAIPETISSWDAELAAHMYRRWPSFGDEAPPVRQYQAEIHMGGDRNLFEESDDGLPLYEGRMIDQYDHRAKAWRSGRGRAAVWEPLSFGDTRKDIAPQWRIPRHRVPKKVRERIDRYRIGWGDVTAPRNERSLTAALIPPEVICGHSVPTFLFPPDSEWAYMLFLAVANSFCADFLIRKKVTLHVTFSALDSMPFPRLPIDHPTVSRLGPRALALSCTAPEMIEYWNRMSEHGWCRPVGRGAVVPGVMDENERARLQAEIDAIVAHELFELSGDELIGILDTFPVLRRREERIFGEFRTKRLVMGAYEELASAPIAVAAERPASYEPGTASSPREQRMS